MKRKIGFLLFICLIISNLFCQNSPRTDWYKACMQVKNPNIIYDSSYVMIKYPMGDVLADRGVCTDVIIRIYRVMGADLQKLVHEDMRNNFIKYPSQKIWGLSTTDTNIDHRRLPNLMTFFKRNGEVLPITDNPNDYKCGEIVVWDLGNGILHIGMVTLDLSKPIDKRQAIIHNIGYGQVIEDCLFKWKIIGHYRYIPKWEE